MDLTVGRFLRFVIAIFIMAVIGWILYELSNIITILIISALLAYILDPFASYLEAKGLSRSQASMLIFVVLILVVGLSTWLLGGKLFNELSSLQQSSAVVDSSRVKPGDLTPDTLRVSLNQTKNTPFREEAASRGEQLMAYKTIVEDMQQAGFTSVRPVYVSLKRGWAVCVLGRI